MATIDLISGFLGAGKTTFIRPYAAWLKANGKPFVVVENEFSFLNVDSAMLREDGMEVTELSGGCICCGLKKNFRALLLMLSSSRDCTIVVEPSGIFNPRDFFDLMAEPIVAASCRIGTVATVVDPHVFHHLDGGAMAVMLDQLNSAGIIIMSKTAGMSADAIAESVEKIRAMLDDPRGTRILTTAWDQLRDADFTAVSTAGSKQPASERRYLDHNGIYTSLVIRSDRPFRRDDLSQAIASLPVGLVRLKGFVPNPDGGNWEINCTARDRSIKPGPAKARAFLVAIGSDLDRDALEQVFRSSN
ncbi:MAG: GTP-binding protein [Planctomycetes bacterium]|nr:GTP-binding protein [Planctomycetota bacterium]